LAWGNNKFVAVASSVTGSDDGKIAYSQDGINWTEVPKRNIELKPEQRFFYGFDALIWANNMFIGAKYSSIIMTSSDGITWSFVEQDAFKIDARKNSEIKAIAWGNGVFIAGGTNGRMASSPDGTTWTALPDGENGFSDNSSIHDIIFANDKFIAVGGVARGGGDGIIAIGEIK